MSVDPDDIFAWQRLDGRTTTSGRLLAEDIGKLADAGIRPVINLAPDGEGNGSLAGEAELLAERDVRYTYIPVRFLAPEESQFEAFRTAYEADGEPVHVHCIANWRVSAFFYRYNRDVRGMAEGEARALMQQQWSPGTSDYAEVWAPFIARRD
jgi:uncharacterized protein (TIGR01244 family)